MIIYVRTWNTERLSFGESKEQLSSFIKKRFQGEVYKKFREKKEKNNKKRIVPVVLLFFNCRTVAGHVLFLFFVVKRNPFTTTYIA